MRNKKFIAILTLAVFMMTLLPMAAFADVSAANVTLSKNSVGVGSDYTVNFNVGAAGALTAGAGTITLTFPAGFTVPQKDAGDLAAASDITVNGTNVATVLVGNKGGAADQTVVITTPVNIANNGAVEIVIKEAVGITNKAAADTALTVTIATSVEAIAVASNVFAVREANRFATVVTSDKTSLNADGSATVKFTVYTYDANNQVVTGAPNVIVASGRGITDTFRNSADTLALPAATSAPAPNYEIVTDTTGKAEFKVKSSVAGTAKIGIGLKDSSTATDHVYAYLTGVANATIDSAAVVTTKEITFTSPSSDSVAVVGTPVAGDSTAVAGSGSSSSPYYSATINGNNVDYYEVAYKVAATNGAPIADQEVTFSANKTEVMLSRTSATTDATGVVKVKMYASKPGSYKIKATAGDNDVETYVKFADNDIYNIELVSGGNEVIAKDAPYKIKFKLNDINGNQIKWTDATARSANYIATNAAAPKLKLEAVVRPTDAAMDEKIYDNNATADYEFKNTTEGYLQLEIKGKELDKEGDYKIKAYFDNGKSVDIPFTVKKQGTVIGLTLAYDQASVAVGASVGAPTVKRLDAEGVSKSLTSAEVASDVIFSASDVRMIFGSIAADGSFNTATDEKYAGTLVITAVDKSKNLTGVATIALAKTASGLVVTAPEGKVNVGADAVVKAQIVDVEGNAVALGTGATAVDVNYYVTSKPAGAIVTTSTPSTILANMQEKGVADLKISSNVAGDVKVQIVVTTTGAGGPYTKDVTLTFGEQKPEVTYGAKNVTMFIGSTGFVQDGSASAMDQAPFIQDNRTFVPVRVVATALGATNEDTMWDAATQTVTLVRPDLTVTMTIGSNVLTLSDGTTVVSDVAPFIVAESGRTVLPFRAIAEAFGATVEAVFAADGTVNAVTFQQ